MFAVSANLIDLQFERPYYVAVQIKLLDETLTVCCIYSSPSESRYRWDLNTLESLLIKLEEMPCCELSVTGDINFDQTDWTLFFSTVDYEKSVLEWIVNTTSSPPVNCMLQL